MKDVYKRQVIHMDPVETNNAQVISLKEMAVATVKGLDARLTLHDFRIVEGTKRINLIFDLVVPREYTKQMQDALKLQVCQRIREQDERCYCVITTESVSYTHLF